MLGLSCGSSRRRGAWVVSVAGTTQQRSGWVPGFLKSKSEVAVGPAMPRVVHGTPRTFLFRPVWAPVGGSALHRPEAHSGAPADGSGLPKPGDGRGLAARGLIHLEEHAVGVVGGVRVEWVSSFPCLVHGRRRCRGAGEAAVPAQWALSWRTSRRAGRRHGEEVVAGRLSAPVVPAAGQVAGSRLLCRDVQRLLRGLDVAHAEPAGHPRPPGASSVWESAPGDGWVRAAQPAPIGWRQQ